MKPIIFFIVTSLLGSPLVYATPSEYQIETDLMEKHIDIMNKRKVWSDDEYSIEQGKTVTGATRRGTDLTIKQGEVQGTTQKGASFSAQKSPDSDVVNVDVTKQDGTEIQKDLTIKK